MCLPGGKALRWLYVRLCWPYLAPGRPYVGPSLAYVGLLLAPCGARKNTKFCCLFGREAARSAEGAVRHYNLRLPAKASWPGARILKNLNNFLRIFDALGKSFLERFRGAPVQHILVDIDEDEDDEYEEDHKDDEDGVDEDEKMKMRMKLRMRIMIITDKDDKG